ncbi:MAG: endonuclease NucS domain-containing protein [Pseudomonadota bacterium]|jgi:hypothetical protein
MSEEQTKALSLKAAYAFGATHGLEHEVNEIRDMDIEWDSSYTSTLRRGYIVDLFEKHGIFDEFKAKHWLYGNSPGGERKRRFYFRVKKQYEDYLAGRGPETGSVEEIEDNETDQQFAAEADLRDFLAKNLNCIEQGLTLYQSGDQTGIEFPIEGGYIDILAVDRNRRFVAIELKVSKGRNKAVGQILYYMGWVDKNLGTAPCRGMIIAKEIPDDLILAVQRAPGISLYKYNLSVSVEPVALKS